MEDWLLGIGGHLDVRSGTSHIGLEKKLGIKRQRETVVLESAVRESKANAEGERADNTFAFQFRTTRHQLKARSGAKIGKRIVDDGPFYCIHQRVTQ